MSSWWVGEKKLYLWSCERAVVAITGIKITTEITRLLYRTQYPLYALQK
jgi:hypothetical protein